MTSINMSDNSRFGEFQDYSCEKIFPILQKIKDNGLKSLNNIELAYVTEHIRTCSKCMKTFNQES